MLRLIFFLIGIACGFAAAIIALPLPGKTFFNRMSKLPPGAQNLIDNSIDLGISFFRLVSTGAREFSAKANKVAISTSEKIKAAQARYHERKEEAAKEAKNERLTQEQEIKEEVGV